MQILQFFPSILLKLSILQNINKELCLYDSNYMIEIPDVSRGNPHGRMLWLAYQPTCRVLSAHFVFFWRCIAQCNRCHCPLQCTRSSEQNECLGQLLLAQLLLLNNRSSYLLIMYRVLSLF